MRCVKEIFPPRARLRWLLMTMRLSNSSFTGSARTDVAVGSSSEASMFLATAADGPRRVTCSGPSFFASASLPSLVLPAAAAGLAGAGAGFAAGAAAFAGAAAWAGALAGAGWAGAAAGFAAGACAAGRAGVAVPDAFVPVVGAAVELTGAEVAGAPGL